jgi:hypothetical protein
MARRRTCEAGGVRVWAEAASVALGDAPAGDIAVNVAATTVAIEFSSVVGVANALAPKLQAVAINRMATMPVRIWNFFMIPLESGEINLL